MCLRDQSKDLPVNLSRLADLGLLLKLDIMASGSLEVKDATKLTSREDQVDIKRGHLQAGEGWKEQG